MGRKLKEKLDDIISEGVAVEVEEYKHNIIRIKERIKALGYSFRDNLVRQVFEYSFNGSEWKDLEERTVKNIWLDFQLNAGFDKRDKPSIPLLYDLIDTDIYSWRYHPVEEYYKSLKWDGKDHITALANTVTVESRKLPTNGGDTAQAWHLLFRRWLISCVACNLGRNANQVCLVFIGGQGLYKTTWLQRLSPPALSNYAFCGNINPSLTDNFTANLAAEKTMVIIDDQLKELFYRDYNGIKSLISCTFINNRKAFRRDEKKRPRICNFSATVNDEKIFMDVQNRRYLTFKIKSIEKDYITGKKPVNIDQVWAQALHYLNKGDQYYFDKVDEAIIQEMNHTFTQVTAEEEWFSRMYEPCDDTHIEAVPMMFSEMLSDMSKASNLKLSSYRLSAVLDRLKIKNKSTRLKGNAIQTARYCYYVLRRYDKTTGGFITLHNLDYEKQKDPKS
jgi:predicted P-loop ATPase